MTMNELEVKEHLLQQVAEVKARLNGLREELEIIRGLTYLSFNAKDVCYSWYGHEINCCEGRVREIEKAIEEIKNNGNI